MNFPEQLRNVINDAYENGTTRVRVGNEEGEGIHVGQGVKQGCPLSPLIFNFCLNPLLTALERHGQGYTIINKINEEVNVTVQAYADDVILFSDSREGMNRNIEIVEQFIRYAKLEVNCNKCHTMSYVINNNNKRDYDNSPFTLMGEKIHSTTLAESITYLGTTTAATNRVREHGADDVTNEVTNLIHKIDLSPLSLTQKVHALKTFALPKLDFVLTEGKVQLGKMKELDTMIRKVIRNHLNSNIPSEVFYTHWKDGGFGITPLHERARILRIKSFFALYNSLNAKTRCIMREFTDRERRFRGIEIAQPGNNMTTEQKQFINWRVEGKIRKGTDTIAIKAKEACEHFNVQLKLDEGDLTLSVNKALIESKKDEESPNKENYTVSQRAEQEEINRANSTIVRQHKNTSETEEEVIVTEARDIPKLLTKIVRKNMQEKLTSRPATGHSFRNIKDACYANSFIGNYKCSLNDNIVRWIVKARTNMLINGNMVARNSINVHGAAICCPYCGTRSQDTVNHRLNSCERNKLQKKTRHNMVQRVILEELTRKFGQNKVTIDKGVNINGQQVAPPFNRLRPDIVVTDEKTIHIVEFTVPYDHLKEDKSEAMVSAYQQKVDKYRDLVIQCRTQFNMKVDLTIVVVSSLGAILKKSIKEVKKLLGLNIKAHKAKTNRILRRMSMAACIGSYFIYYNIKFRENDQHKGLNDNESDMSEKEATENEDLPDNTEEDDTEQTQYIEDRKYKNSEPTIILPEDESTEAVITVTNESNKEYNSAPTTRNPTHNATSPTPKGASSRGNKKIIKV